MRTRTKKRDPELEALARLPDEEIDTSEIPEVTDWRKAVVGRFYRPIKKPVTLRLDVDIIAWFRSEGPGYQTRINALLRTAMLGSPADVGALESAKIQSDTGPEPEGPGFAFRNLRFPSLEKHRELDKCTQVANLIEKRGCVFALAP